MAQPTKRTLESTDCRVQDNCAAQSRSLKRVAELDASETGSPISVAVITELARASVGCVT